MLQSGRQIVGLEMYKFPKTLPGIGLSEPSMVR